MGADNETKSSSPRWIIWGTALAGLVAAVLVAAAKYYEFQKARADVVRNEPASVPDQTEPKHSPTPQTSKEAPKSSDTESLGFTKGSVWEGAIDRGGQRLRVTVKSANGNNFECQMETIFGGKVTRKYTSRGTIASNKQVTLSFSPNDLVWGDKLGGGNYVGSVNGGRYTGQWTVEGHRDAFDLIRQ